MENKNIDLTKATEIAREWIKENRVMNLFYHGFRMERASKIKDKDKWLVICSTQEDFQKRTYYVFQIDFKGIILKIGIGILDGETIKVKEYKIDWDTLLINNKDLSKWNGFNPIRRCHCGCDKPIPDTTPLR